MALSPLERSILNAEATTKRLRRILRRLGTREFNQGKVRVAYRVAQRGVAAALKQTNTLRRSLDLRDALDALRLSVGAAVQIATEDAQSIGGGSSVIQLRYYGEPETGPIDEALIAQEETKRAAAAVVSSLAIVEAQIAQVKALALLREVSPGLATGGTGSPGVLNPAPVVSNAFSLAMALAWASYLAYVVATGGAPSLIEFFQTQELPPTPYSYQAIAALDERTTNTCLAVHAQIVPIGDDFKLTRDPRPFGDELPGPPFHYYCRTALALYKSEFDLGLTERMRTDAAAVMAEKEAGSVKEKHPASATTN